MYQQFERTSKTLGDALSQVARREGSVVGGAAPLRAHAFSYADVTIGVVTPGTRASPRSIVDLGMG